MCAKPLAVKIFWNRDEIDDKQVAAAPCFRHVVARIELTALLRYRVDNVGRLWFACKRFSVLPITDYASMASIEQHAFIFVLKRI